MKKNMRINFMFLLKQAFLILLSAILLNSCQEDFGGHYDKPEGLEGPIYEQLASNDNFTEFAKAINKLEVLKQAINSSGLYTVFAPTNEAMKSYLDKPIEDYNMSIEEDSMAIVKLVNSHILFNMYFKYNFDEFIDEDEPIFTDLQFSLDKYRFGSRYRAPDYMYEDLNVAPGYKRKIRPDYKALNIYTQKYITKYKMSSDYQDIYGFVPGDFNIEEAQVLEDSIVGGEMVKQYRDIPAKNGVIHGINRVIELKPTVEEVLEEVNPSFYRIIDRFNILIPYQINFKDTLFKKFNFINFSQEDEVATILCPDENQFNQYLDDNVLPNFNNDIDSIPNITAEYLLLTYFVNGRKWLSDVENFIINFDGDTLENLDISETHIASNGLVYVTSDLILSSTLTSVVKVALLDKKYSWFAEMLYNSDSNVDDYLSYLNGKFTFFVPTNEALENVGIERLPSSSVGYKYYWNGLRMLSKQTDSLLNYLIIPNEELNPADYNYNWFATRSGNFMLFKDGLINGTITAYDQVDTDNGYAYTLNELPIQPKFTVNSYLGSYQEDTMFNYLTKIWYWDRISEDSTIPSDDEETIDYLLKKSEGGFSFATFVPTDSAIQAYKTDNGLGSFETDSVWQDIVQYHIVKTRLYSEGSYQSKPDNPLPTDETKFLTFYKDIVYDEDNIFEKDNYAWMQYDESQKKVINQNAVEANLTSAYDIETLNGVVHFIDKVLTPPVRQFPDKN